MKDNREEYIKRSVNILWKKLFEYEDHYHQMICAEKMVESLSEKLVEEASPKAIQYDKESLTVSPSDRSSLYNEILSEQQEYDNRLNFAKAHLKEIETFVNLVEDEEIREIIEYKFFRFNTWKRTEKKFSRSRGSLEYSIRRELSKLINVI